MEVKIRLLKAWSNDGKDYEEGQILKTTEEAAEMLVSQGIAEIYTPKKGDQILASLESGGLSQEEVTKLITETITASIKEESKAFHGSPPEDELDAKGGFDEFWQFAKAVQQAGPGGQNACEKLVTWDKSCRTKTTGYMEEGDQAQGGYLVPTEHRNQILEVAIEENILRGRCTIVPMSSNSVKIPYVRDVSHATSTHGGVIIYRPDELGSLTVSNATYGQIGLNLHRLAGLVHLSNDLLEDSPISMEPIVTRQFGEAIGWQEMDDLLWGTGAGMALGAMNAPCVISVAKETDQDADTILTENIVKMYSRMHSRGHRSAVWLAQHDCMPQLMTLTLNVGTGGAPVGLVRAIEQAPYMSILGRPLYLSEHMDTIGDAGDIMYADWSQYLLGQRAGASAIKFATSIHLKFDYDLTSFRFIMRYDGQPWWPSSFTPKRSTVTLSPFIKLAARA